MCKLILILGIASVFTGCEYSSIDERDNVIGSYSGICTNTYWVDTIVRFVHDTFPLTVIITKSESHSIIDLNFTEINTSTVYSFYYEDGKANSLLNYHPPLLTLNRDSLYFIYKPGLGPWWKECYARKK